MLLPHNLGFVAEQQHEMAFKRLELLFSIG